MCVCVWDPSHLCPLRGAGSCVTTVISGACNNQVSDPQYSFLPKDSRPLREEADSRWAGVSWSMLSVQTWRRLRAADGVSQRTREQSGLTSGLSHQLNLGQLNIKTAVLANHWQRKIQSPTVTAATEAWVILLRIVLTRIIKRPVFILEF